ncbi:hypothetical protein Sjap_003999 [Stephania japonica]|uniref:Uncharacterized protein n=1 Tax=Stephania japonica TaxID=461633 RepID=A0AAP0K1L8_9MAGN
MGCIYFDILRILDDMYRIYIWYGYLLCAVTLCESIFREWRTRSCARTCVDLGKRGCVPDSRHQHDTTIIRGLDGNREVALGSRSCHTSHDSSDRAESSKGKGPYLGDLLCLSYFDEIFKEAFYFSVQSFGKLGGMVSMPDRQRYSLTRDRHRITSQDGSTLSQVERLERILRLR